LGAEAETLRAMSRPVKADRLDLLVFKLYYFEPNERSNVQKGPEND
jgi:hypothetical protein